MLASGDCRVGPSTSFRFLHATSPAKLPSLPVAEAELRSAQRDHEHRLARGQLTGHPGRSWRRCGWIQTFCLVSIAIRSCPANANASTKVRTAGRSSRSITTAVPAATTAILVIPINISKCRHTTLVQRTCASQGSIVLGSRSSVSASSPPTTSSQCCQSA